MAGHIQRTVVSKDHKRIFTDAGVHSDGHCKAVTLASDCVDSRSSPTTLIQPGQVVGKESAGTYVDAGDAGVTTSAAATHTGAASPTFAGAETATFKVNSGITISVTTATADTTLGAVVTALNADEDFNSVLFAEDSSSKLKISTIEGGSGQILEIVSSPAGWKLTAGTYVGTDGEYGVVMHHCDMLDATGSAAALSNVKIAQRGQFDTSALNGLTADARRYLQQRGSIFD